MNSDEVNRFNSRRICKDCIFNNLEENICLMDYSYIYNLDKPIFECNKLK